MKHQIPTPKSSYPPLTDLQLRRSIYFAVLITILLPPFVGGTLMGLVGFYPLPEFYLIFFSYTGIYLLAVLLAGLTLAPRIYHFIVNLTQLDHAFATSTAQSIFSRLPWYLSGAVTLYSIAGALSADYSLEAMGIRQYNLREHLYNQFGIIPVVLITVFPIFFYFIDRLGRYLGPRGISVTAIPLWIRMLMLGIGTPLLIDSLLIGYYYNRTGYFQLETIALWFSLLALAAAGVWLAWHSLRQGIYPLEMFIAARTGSTPEHTQVNLTPLSLDELGVLTASYAELLSTQQQLSDDLQRTQSLTDSVIDNAGALVVVLNQEGRIVRFNQACEKVSGFSFAEIKGKFPWETVLPPEDAESIQKKAFEILAHNPQAMAGHHTNHWVNKHGERTLIEWANTVLLNDQGHLEHVVSVGTDITERQHAKKLLEQSEGRLNEAQRIAKVGSWELDLSNGNLIWSDEIFNIFEIEKTQFPASYAAFLDGIHPDDKDMVNQAYTDSLVNQAPYEIVHRLMMADGRIKYVRENCKSFFSTDGKPIRSMGTVQDISELRKAEEELHRYHEHLEDLVHERTTELERQNQRNELILGTTVDGFFAANQDGRMIDVNPAFCRMLGYSNEELLQLSIADIEGNENPQEVATHVKKVFTDGHDRFDTCHRCKDGSHVDVEVSVNLVELANEKIFYAFIRDISERKLGEQRLTAARDEAERANTAKSEFLSRMSHELRTPLNAILGFGQLLEIDTEHPLTQQQSQDVHEILYAGNHLLELVNEVLDLSRIESGHLRVTLEAVTIAPIIEACVAQLSPLAAASNISTTFDLEKHYSVMADQMRLKEVLLNLLSNAIKYNHQGGSIQLSCAPVGDGRLRISVRDTGRGIAANAVPRLFKPFERMETSYDGIEGTGVGLALSKKLLDAMHGDIGVQTVLGEGSTFWFELPLAGKADVETEITPDAVTTDNDGRRIILYVEDNLSNQRLVQTVLATRKDIELLNAVSAEAGLEIIASQHVDLVLLDINLPGMDGFEALEHLKNIPTSRDIPVIALTANAMSDDIERGKANGFVDYLSKPIDIARFLNLLEHCLP